MAAGGDGKGLANTDTSSAGEAHGGLIQPRRGMTTYGSYLKVDSLLALQQPLTEPSQHDELLFIIIHQVYELWFKQILHEVGLLAQSLQSDQLMVGLRAVKRIQTIQSVLTHQVDVLETMTPVDFNAFRDRLNPASGFQSLQFRLLEYVLGARDPGYLAFHRHDPEATSRLQAVMALPSLADEFVALLARRGFAIATAHLHRDWSMPYASHPDVLQAVLSIYRHASQHYDLYLILEALMDLDEGLVLWRQRHVTMVERMIGHRRGTGGSSGARYLSSTLGKRFFPEIWEARNWLGVAGYGGTGQDDSRSGE